MRITLIIFLVIIFFLLIIGLIFYIIHPSKQNIPEQYNSILGCWESISNKDIYVCIYPDGTAAYKAPSSNISGGSIRFKDDSFTIYFGPFKKEFIINKFPVKKANNLVAVFNNIEYYNRENNSIVELNQQISPESASSFNKKYFSFFINSLESSDMLIFYNEIGTIWKNQTSPEELNNIFSVFIEKKDLLVPILKEALNMFPSKSSIKVDSKNDKLIDSVNTIPVSNKVVNLECKYTFVNGDFEIVSFKISIN